jgi:probable HAF family extracellular repeat protein
MIDLGTVPGDACSNAYQVNSRGQVVGTSENQTICSLSGAEHAFLWEHGGPMVDLNTLIPRGSNLELTLAVNINDRGEIGGIGVPPGCQPLDYGTCGHAYVLIPCDEKHGDGGDCEDTVGGTAAAADVNAVADMRGSTAGAPRKATLTGTANPMRRRFGGHLTSWHGGLGVPLPQ